MSEPNPIKCREASCGQYIFFVQSARDPAKKVPVDAESLNQDDLDALGRGETVVFDRKAGHISHFETCEKPGQFSRPRK